VKLCVLVELLAMALAGREVKKIQNMRISGAFQGHFSGIAAFAAHFVSAHRAASHTNWSLPERRSCHHPAPNRFHSRGKNKLAR